MTSSENSFSPQLFLPANSAQSDTWQKSTFFVLLPKMFCPANSAQSETWQKYTFFVLLPKYSVLPIWPGAQLKR